MPNRNVDKHHTDPRLGRRKRRSSELPRADALALPPVRPREPGEGREPVEGNSMGQSKPAA